MAKKQKKIPFPKKPTVKFNWKTLIEQHPLFAVAGAISILLNLVAVGWSSFGSIFGERVVFSETYVEASADDILSENENSFFNKQSCPIIENEIYRTFVKFPEKKWRITLGEEDVQSDSFISGEPKDDSARVVMILARNAGSSMARDVDIASRHLPSARSQFPPEAKGYDLADFAVEKGYPVYGGLFGLDGIKIVDPNERKTVTRIGDIAPSGCVAIPMAIVAPDLPSGYEEMLQPLIIPVNIQFRRVFGFWREVHSFRPMNTTPMEVRRGIIIRG